MENYFTYEEALNASIEYFNGDELAATTFLSKYALKKYKNGSDQVLYIEKTPIDMHHRLTKELHRIEQKYPNSLSYDEIFNLLDRFKYVVPGGSVMYKLGNYLTKGSLSNCIVTDSPKDSISGIMNIAKEHAILYKGRCGVGTSLDTLRPEGMKVNNSAGTSTGAWSFAELYSNVCKAIGQSGRRGALALTLNVKHPDVVKFATMKLDLTKVTGANVSIMITDEFINAVKNNEIWTMQYPIDVPLEEAKFVTQMPARELWYIINQAAVKCAEPGILLWSNYQANLPANCYPDFKIISINPCGELGLAPYGSCRLTSINLSNFVENEFTDKARFNIEFFETVVRKALRILDDIVDLEIESLQEMIDKADEEDEKELWKKLQNSARRGRQTGLGTHGLADCLAKLCIKYDTEEAINKIHEIYSILRNAAYDESVNLAIERGPFEVFDWELEKECIFIKRLPIEIQNRIKKYGRRNISLLTNAPTGTVSLMSQTSSGIEPVFNYAYYRKRRINSNDKYPADVIDINGEKWIEFPVFHHNAIQYINKHKETKEQWEKILAEKKDNLAHKIRELLPNYFVSANEIDPFMRVKIQGAIQLYIDAGISSTINLPENTPAEVTMEIYNKAYEEGLKGVTIYVKGSREGVLIDDSIKTNKISFKRPEILSCDIHHSQIMGKEWIILVGIHNGEPYEIFGGLEQENIIIPKKYKTGRIKKRKCEIENSKVKRNCYDLIIGDEDDPLIINDIVHKFNNDDYSTQTRQLSLMLRKKIPIVEIVDVLAKDKKAHIFSFEKVMARVLKKYIKDGTRSSEDCSECGMKLVFENGCYMCKNCGFSKCS